MKKTNEILPYIRLRFNLEHPTFENCYIEGYEACGHSLEESSNPFKPNSAENEQWSQGWWDNFYGEEALFQYSTIEDDELEHSYQQDRASNEPSFYGQETETLLDSKQSKITLVAKVAAMVAASFLSYQVIDLIA
jgi:hypothetical protein